MSIEVNSQVLLYVVTSYDSNIDITFSTTNDTQLLTHPVPVLYKSVFFKTILHIKC